MPALRQPDDGDAGELVGSSGQGETGDKVGGKAPSQQAGGATNKDLTGGPAAGDQTGSPGNAKKPVEQMTEAEVQKRLEEREDKQFAAAEFALRQAIQDVPVLKNLADNLIIDRTPEGLCIQIVDQEKRSMIPLRSAQIADNAQKLTGLIAQVVQKLPNKVSITNHTDAAPYAFGHTNWELSAERDSLVPEDPRAARNRRISIVLLSEAKLPAPASQAQAPP